MVIYERAVRIKIKAFTMETRKLCIGKNENLLQSMTTCLKRRAELKYTVSSSCKSLTLRILFRQMLMDFI